MPARSVTAPSSTRAEFVRVREVFRRLGISDNVGYGMIEDGSFPIPVVTIGAIKKCRSRDVEAFIAGDTISTK
jgi:predicted DNA-binding transcriptional regulator AlpA